MRCSTVLGFLALLLVGCADRSPAASGDLPGAAAAVERFFAVVAAEDCDALRRLATEPLDNDKCAALFRDFRERDASLIRVADARPDGRDPRAALVTAHLRFKNVYTDEHQWIVRAERRKDGWRVVVPR